MIGSGCPVILAINLASHLKILSKGPSVDCSGTTTDADGSATEVGGTEAEIGCVGTWTVSGTTGIGC